MRRLLPTGGLAGLAILALFLGPGPFVVVLTLLAVTALLDLGGVLARASARPILPVALLPAIGMPLVAATEPRAWRLLPLLAAGAFLATFVVALLAGRRRGVVEAAGSTLLAGIFVGLGTGSLVLLHALPDGPRWVLAFLLVVLAADVGAPLAERLGSARRARHASTADGDLLGPAAAAAVAAVAAAVLLRPPLGLVTATLLGLVGLTAAVGATDLLRALRADATDSLHPRPTVARIGDGLLLGAVDGMLLGAPAAYVIARSSVL